MYKAIISLLLLITVFFSACQKDAPDGIWVRFQNDTEVDIQEAVMWPYQHSSARVGAIAAGQSSDYVYFNAFPAWKEESKDKLSMPNGNVVGKVAGQEVSFGPNIFCATGMEVVGLAEGNYVLHLRTTVNYGRTSYWLEF